ncbi:MAG: hypothetical protein H0V17_13490, partial [Deltaproteobacteria bacterium]|nr:hypothetical protein [Deltaproteobacteria bacterium]
LILVVLSLATACTTAGDDGSEAGFIDGGKADGPSAAVVSAAKQLAESFEFDGASDTEIDRADAPVTGPSPVRAAFLLHRSWEDNDLGAARLYRWRVAGYRVWAVRTSTDGDDSFIELFDGRGEAFASGVGGFVADGAGFRPTITWDATIGAVRDRIAPRDISGDVEGFWSKLDAAGAPDSTSGARITKAELTSAVEQLLAGAPTTNAIDGWEVAAVYRALADREREWSYGSRGLAGEIAEFYRAPFVTLGGITAPSIKTVLGLPTALSTKIGLARVARPQEFLIGLPVMNQLAQKLGVLPASALPTTKGELTARLQAAGATSTQAAHALEVLGMNDRDAHIFRGGAFTSDSGRPTQVPGTVWFVDSPASSFVTVLRIVPDANELTTFGARGLDTIEELTGTRRPATLVQVRPRLHGAILDLEYTRPDQGVLAVSLTLGTAATVSLRAVSPSIDPELRGNLATLITEVKGGEADVIAVVGEGPAYHVVYRSGAAQPRLARVDFGPRTVSLVQPTTLADAVRRALALSAARHHAERMVAEVSPLAQLEVLLRTAWATPTDLETVTADSAVGFDPATELAQFMLGSVWGDNAVFVTYRRNGEVRIEDFN